MSVPASKRKEAETLFYTHFYKTYDEIVRFLMRDFGTKSIKELNVFTNRAKMDIIDKQEFDNLASKYNLSVQASYPEWVLESYRNIIMDALNKTLEYITEAYTIYPNTVYECDLKRQHQWNAISSLQYIKQILQRVISLFTTKEVDVERYMIHIDNIDKEIELLRKWKQADNKVRYKCINNEIEKYNDVYEMNKLGLSIPQYNKLKQQKEEYERKERNRIKQEEINKQKELERIEIEKAAKLLRKPVYFFKDYKNCETTQDILKQNSRIFINYKFNNEIKIEVKPPYYLRNPSFTIFEEEKRKIPHFTIIK